MVCPLPTHHSLSSVLPWTDYDLVQGNMSILIDARGSLTWWITYKEMIRFDDTFSLSMKEGVIR